MPPWYPTFAGVLNRAGKSVGVSAVRHRYQEVNLRQRSIPEDCVTIAQQVAREYQAAEPVLTREEVRAMEGARAPEFRPYWIRYMVAFWAGEKLKWARDNILVACLCSLAPGLIAAGISTALSDNKWRATPDCLLCS